MSGSVRLEVENTFGDEACLEAVISVRTQDWRGDEIAEVG